MFAYGTRAYGSPRDSPASTGRGYVGSQSADGHGQFPRSCSSSLLSSDRPREGGDSCHGRAPQACTRGAQTDRIARSSRRQPRAWPAGLALYPESGVQRVNVQVGFGQQLLELVVLGLQFPQPPGIRHVHTAIFSPTFVERCIAETTLAE